MVRPVVVVVEVALKDPLLLYHIKLKVLVPPTLLRVCVDPP